MQIPSGDGNFRRSLRHVPTVVDRSVHSCASVRQGKHVSNFPIGAMGTFEGLFGTYRLLLTGASFAVVQARVEASASAFFPSGRWEVGRWEDFKSLLHVHTVVDRSVSHSCASESRGKRVGSFPIGAMGTFEVSGADGSYSLLVDPGSTRHQR